MPRWLNTVAKLRAAAVCAFALILQSAPASAQPSPAQDQQVNDSAIAAVLGCLQSGKEAMLLRDGVQCAAYGDGAKLLKTAAPDMPLRMNFAQACKDPADRRVLPGTAIKTIAKQQPSPINATGIRLIGAIFCGDLDLVGLEVPYSIVIDRSIVVGSIQARNFRTHGDFSLDGSLVFDELRLARSHVDGTVFASDSFINKMQLLDAEVRGSLLFRRSLFIEPAIFDTVSLSGELSMRDAAFPYFLLQFSKVGGVLDLTGSQARCAYHVRQSEVEELVAVDSGFGTSAARAGQFAWRQLDKHSDLYAAAQRGLPDQRQKALDNNTCDHSIIASNPGTFRIFDSRVKSAFCFRQFHWLGSKAGAEEPSYVTFRDVHVGTRTMIDLSSGNTIQGSQSKSQRNFELVGWDTNSFIFNFSGFSGEQAPYKLSVSGLKFDHVYATTLPCDYDPDFAGADKPGQAPSGSASLRTVSDPASYLRWPSVEEVMTWLNANSLVTTQPFAAFVDVFQKHGEESGAKKLRIARAGTEQCTKARHVFGSLADWSCARSMAPQTPTQASRFDRFIAYVQDLVTVIFGWLLGWIAAYGYHPENVIVWIVVVIAIAAIYFRWCRRIVGFKPKDKAVVLRIGLLFLFDRLIPAYQIRADHYQIETFYKKAPAGHPKYGVKTVPYLWWWRITGEALRSACWLLRCEPRPRCERRTMVVIEATPDQTHHVEKCLDALKIIGLFFAIFLLAAVNALVLH